MEKESIMCFLRKTEALNNCVSIIDQSSNKKIKNKAEQKNLLDKFRKNLNIVFGHDSKSVENEKEICALSEGLKEGDFENCHQIATEFAELLKKIQIVKSEKISEMSMFFLPPPPLFFHITNYSKEAGWEKFTNKGIEDMPRLPISIPSYHAPSYILAKLYFSNREELIKNDEEIALSLFATFEEEEQKWICETNFNFVEEAEGYEGDANVVFVYGLNLERTKLIRRMIIKNRVSEAFILYESISRLIIAYTQQEGCPLFDNDEQNIATSIKEELIRRIDFLASWADDAEKEIIYRDKKISKLSRLIKKKEKSVPKEGDNNSRFRKRTTSMYGLIRDINEISPRVGFSNPVFDWGDVMKNITELKRVFSRQEWERFNTLLYKIIYDGSGQGKRIPSSIKIDEESVFMSIKRLRTEADHGNLDATTQRKIASIYQKYTKKDHFSQLNKKEIQSFQNKLLDDVVVFLSDIKSSLNKKSEI